MQVCLFRCAYSGAPIQYSDAYLFRRAGINKLYTTLFVLIYFADSRQCPYIQRLIAHTIYYVFSNYAKTKICYLSGKPTFDRYGTYQVDLDPVTDNACMS